jgi:hypothetical protein
MLVGWVSQPEMESSPYLTDSDGRAFVPVGCQGVRYNVRVGMPAFGWEADRVQPGASVAHPDAAANRALSLFACVGNRVKVRTGAAAGAVGVVTGKHEEFQRFQEVLVDLPTAALELLAPGDQVAIEAVGRGFRPCPSPAVAAHSLGPELWAAWGPRPRGDGVEVRVSLELPAEAVGMGAGRVAAATSWELQTPPFLLETVPGLAQVRLGDLVAVRDWDAAYFSGYRPGSMVVGVVCHGASRLPGHGLGLTVLLSGREGRLAPELDHAANLADLLSLGTKERRSG